MLFQMYVMLSVWTKLRIPSTLKSLYIELPKTLVFWLGSLHPEHE